MPKNKVQGLVFGILMSVTMAYGVEVYNVANKEGGLAQMTNGVFWDALLEAGYMWLFVFLFSNLWGNRMGHWLASRICREGDNPFLQVLFISGCTVLIMCPTMSLVAAILFSVILGGRLCYTAAGLLGCHCTEKLPHGAILESVCGRAHHALFVPPYLCPSAARSRK